MNIGRRSRQLFSALEYTVPEELSQIQKQIQDLDNIQQKIVQLQKLQNEKQQLIHSLLLTIKSEMQKKHKLLIPIEVYQQIISERYSNRHLLPMFCEKIETNFINPREHCDGVWFEDKLLVFGGHKGLNNDCNEIIEFSEGRWRIVETTKGPVPSGRRAHSVTLLHDCLYVFGIISINGNRLIFEGGYDGQNCNDLWKFDIRSKRWELLSPTGRKPIARYCHSTVVRKDKLYVFGGRGWATTHLYFNDLHCYDPETNSWTKIDVNGEKMPSPRFRTSAVVFRDEMYIFGGHDGTKLTDNKVMFKYNFVLNKWSELVTSGNHPSKREGHRAVVCGNRFFLFGGVASSGFCDTMYELNFDTMHWTQIKYRGESPTGRCNCVFVQHSNYLYIFGGYADFQLNSMYRLRIPYLIIESQANTFIDLLQNQQLVDTIFYFESAKT